MMKKLLILFFPFLLFSQITPPVILWEQTYDFENTSFSYFVNFNSILKTNESNFILTSLNNNGGTIFKINTNGDLIWEQNASLNVLDFGGQSIAQCSDNFFYTLTDNCESSSQASIQQIDNEGNLLNDWCYTVLNNENFNSIIDTSDGGLLVSDGANLYKFNHLKEIEWSVNCTETSLISNIFETSDGFFLAVGTIDYNVLGNNYGGCYIAKYNNLGNIVWEKNFGSVNATFDSVNTLIELPNGNYLLNCLTDGEVENGNSCLNAWMVTTDTAGNIINDLALTPNGTNAGLSYSKIILEPDGGYVVGVFSNCNNPDSNIVYAFRLIKVTAANTIAWDVSFTDGIIYDIERTAEGDYIAVGTDYNPSVFGSGGLKAMKIGWEPLSTPSFESSVSLYPNPAQDYIMVKNNFTENQTVVIYNVAGQTIMKQEINQNENSLDVTKLASGIYFVHLPESNTTLKWIKE